MKTKKGQAMLLCCLSNKVPRPPCNAQTREAVQVPGRTEESGSRLADCMVDRPGGVEFFFVVVSFD